MIGSVEQNIVVMIQFDPILKTLFYTALSAFVFVHMYLSCSDSYRFVIKKSSK